MFETLAALFTVLTSGAGGGLLGGIFGIFKQSQERKERIEMARINVERDQLEYQSAKAERDHALLMLEKGAEIELEKVQTETEAEVEIARQSSLASAQEVFNSLKTTTGMDNYRASVRPTLTYWTCLTFSVMLVWVFKEYGHLIGQEEGKQILLGMFATLTFIVTSVTSFYYVSRRNAAPRV